MPSDGCTSPSGWRWSAWAVALAVSCCAPPAIDGCPTAAVTTLTRVAMLLGFAWAATGTWWGVIKAHNAARLDARSPTVARALRSFWYAPIWVALMSLTLVRLEPHPDLDVRPPIIVGGFLLAMVPPTRLVLRVFRSFVRVVPVGPVVVFGVLETTAFGLAWWRLATWPVGGVYDAAAVELTTGIAFALAIVLLVDAAMVWYLDRAGEVAEQIRVLTMRTRHDHRIARVRGLDPLEPSTRWALMEARRAADLHGGGAVHHVLDVSSWSAIRSTLRSNRVDPSRPGRTTIEPRSHGAGPQGR